MIRLLLAAIRWLATPPDLCDHSYDPAEGVDGGVLATWIHDLAPDPVDHHYSTAITHQPAGEWVELPMSQLQPVLDLVRDMARDAHLAAVLLDEDQALRDALLADYPHLGDVR